MYGKVFKSLWLGSMLGAGVIRQHVLCWMIANADFDGNVEVNPALLAVLFGEPCSESSITAALEWLSLPDPKSRIKEHEGRRIEYIDGFLWRLINHEIYRNIIRAEEAREKTRERVRRHRAKSSLEHVTVGNANVTQANVGVTPSRRQKSEDRSQKTDRVKDSAVPAVSESRSKRKKGPKRAPLASACPEMFATLWSGVTRKERREDAIRAFDVAVAEWGERRAISIFAEQIDAYNAKVKRERIAPQYVKQGGTLFNAILNGDTFGVVEEKPTGEVPF